MLKKKRWLAVLFMVLVFSLSMNTSAASKKAVAKIGKKSYSSLQGALASVKKGQTIKLTKNVTIDGSSGALTFKKNVKYTLNLNKKTIKCKSSGYCFFEKGNVTVKNGKIVMGGYTIKNSSVTFQNVTSVPYSSSDWSRMDISSKAKVTLKNCKFPVTRIEARDKSQLAIQGGTYESIWNYSTGTITINGGSFSKIYNAAEGKTIIKNGKIETNADDTSYLIGVNKGSMEIQNITYNAGTAGITVSEGARLEITGGTVTTQTTNGGIVIYNRGTAKITGGTLRRNNTNEFNREDGIINAGTMEVGAGCSLINCVVVHAN